MSSCACSQIAATTVGLQCPVLQTAIPATRSRYSFPSPSQTVEPFPRTIAMLRENAGM